VYVIDNASTDGTAAWLRSQQHGNPGIMRITFAQPVSVARMWNEALRAAWGMGFEEALAVNADTEFLPETHWVLSEYLTLHPDLGMVTCVSRRERDQVVRAEGPFNPRPHPDYSAYMLKRWAHQRVQFDENCIGGYVEDACHHVEMFRAGIDVVCIDLPFFHHASGTLKTATLAERKQIESNAAHNREYFKSKYGCLPGTKAYESLFTSAAAR